MVGSIVPSWTSKLLLAKDYDFLYVASLVLSTRAHSNPSVLAFGMNSVGVEDHRHDLGSSETSVRETRGDLLDGPAFHLSRPSIPEGAVNVVRRIYRELRGGGGGTR